MIQKIRFCSGPKRAIGRKQLGLRLCVQPAQWGHYPAATKKPWVQAQKRLIHCKLLYGQPLLNYQEENTTSTLVPQDTLWNQFDTNTFFLAQNPRKHREISCFIFLAQNLWNKYWSLSMILLSLWVKIFWSCLLYVLGNHTFFFMISSCWLTISHN